MLGQYDTQMKEQMDSLHGEFPQLRYKDIFMNSTRNLRYMELPSRDPFKRLKEILRSSKYQVINTPKRMNFQALDKLLRKACLPMLVSLELQIGETTYKHVIGICPNKPNDGDEIRYFIVDGSHPKLKAIDFSLENLNWCCGSESSFSVVSEGILFFPTAVRTQQIIENWSTLYHTMEDILGVP